MSANQNAAGRGLGRLLSKVAPIETEGKCPRSSLRSVCSSVCLPATSRCDRCARPSAPVLGKERVADLFVITWIASLAIVPI